MHRPLTFETHYTLDDHRAVQRYLVRRSVRKQRTVRMCVAIGIVVAYLGLAFSKPWIVTSPAFAIGSVMFAALLAVLVFLGRRLCVPAEGGAFLQQHRFEFDDEGIRITSRDRDTFYRWSAVRSWALAPSHLFLLIDENAAIVIPRRSLGGRNEEEELRELIQLRTGLAATR